MWFYGLIPWWLGMTIAVSLIAGGQFPAHNALALAGEVVLGFGLVLSAAWMVAGFVLRGRRG